ncbi:ABC transporter substrate-binding protein [Pseudonocardia nematodicida]|uniref:ABC transporter substrate-binding protein n=1 Tax=Pseudonocardia nematodicida TaxID=1206997 RepID=A0ABV1K6A1_9PSEU
MRSFPSPAVRTSPAVRISAAVRVAVACVAVAVLAACGQVAVEPGDAAPVDARDPYGAPAGSEGAPTAGGTLVLAMDRDVVGFDPTVQNSNMVATAIYDSLMRFDADGEVQPYLAEGMESPDGGTTWLLTLREGVRFHDGTPLDAEAVVVNTQRHIDVGSSPANRFARQIAGMRAVDPLRVEFTLAAPLGDFPVAFAQTFNSGTLGVIISPAELARPDADVARRPVGAGPFRFVEWRPGTRVVVERNDDYWQEGLPHLDGLEFRPLTDTETRQSSIANGDVDVSFAAYNQELVRSVDDPGLRVYYGPGSGGEYLYFNHDRAPFDDRRMREAFIRAIDLDALAVAEYRGHMSRAVTMFSPDTPHSNPEAAQAWPEFDADRARALVEEYRAEGGDPDFRFVTTQNRVPFAEFVQAQLAAVGVTVEVEFFDLAQYSSAVAQSRDFQLAQWVGPFDNPYPAVQRLLHSEGNTNFGNYANPRVDELLDLAESTADEGERVRAYQDVELVAAEDLSHMWFSRSYLSTITDPAVHGVDRYVTREMFFASTWLQR